MNRREALETILKVKNVCKERSTCDGCPYDLDNDTCTVCLLGRIMENDFIELVNEKMNELDKPPIENDTVNHPNHYCKGGIECIEAIKAAVVGLVAMEAVCTANVIKYIWRWKFKNGLEDLKKAKWYLDRLIKEVEEANNNVNG